MVVLIRLGNSEDKHMFTRLWLLGLFAVMATLAQDRTAAEPSSTAQALQTLLSEVRQLRRASNVRTYSDREFRLR
jgi:hypothetical protein